MIYTGPLSSKSLTSINLVLGSIGVITIGINLMMGVALRPGGFLLLMSSLLGAWFIRQKKHELGTQVFLWCMLLVGFVAGLSADGISSPGWVAYPLVLFTAHIYLSRRQVLLMCSACFATLLFLFIKQKNNGVIHNNIPPMVWLIAIVIACIMALIIASEVRDNINNKYKQISTAYAQLEALINNSMDLIWTIRVDTLSLDRFSKSFHDTYKINYSTSPSSNSNIAILFPEQADEWQNSFKEAAELGEIIINLKIGNLLYENCIKFIPLMHNTGIFLIASRDITKKHLEVKNLEKIAFYDELTSLPNRNYLHEYIRTTIASASRQKTKIAVLFIDMDDFKKINDSFGHHVGDLVLRDAAKSMRSALRAEDMLIRLSGDEFLAILTNIQRRDEIKIACDRLKNNFENTKIKIPGNSELTYSVSIGVAVYPDDSKTFEELLEKADQALYAVKAAGGASYRFI